MALMLLCIKIFFVRIIDVSLGTIRTIFTVKGKVLIASLIGFVEVLVWFLIVKDALNNSGNSYLIALFYALGFSCGTYVGGYLANYFNKHTMINVQVIVKDKSNIIGLLRKKGFAVSVLNVKGYDEENKLLLFSGISVNDFKLFKKIVTDNDRKAFIVVSDTRAVYNGYFIGNTR